MSDESPRAVFDCNVFLQGAANRRSPARSCLRLFFDGAISLFVSEPILREVREVLSRPAIRLKLPRLTDRLVNALIMKIESRAIIIKNVPEEFHYERDPKDEPYVNLALVANASYLVSQDKDLLDLMTISSDAALGFRFRYPFLRILKAADFVREIDRERGRDSAP
jgi:putative PIN family toxin of toxin-antitoxin system